MHDDARPAARLTVLSGPSGVGKDSVIELIRARAPWVRLSVSATTRRKRDYEVDGVHYHFVDRAEFTRLVEGDQLLEWAEFAGNLYGTPRSQVEGNLAAGISTLLKIDLQGARQVRARMPQARLVFLAPPSVDELKRRLVGRGTDDADTIARRLSHADEELAAEKEFDVTIVNDFVERAADELLALLRSPAGPAPAATQDPAPQDHAPHDHATQYQTPAPIDSRPAGARSPAARPTTENRS